ncbi:MAG: hypothetical protein KQ78_01992 [Candidatus Izimaplasma bacterium HR2]|nr:MAG: hypothetical protein KQ78_01992 [Candidatus Izimaplasma bacterium HR2]
MFTKEFRDKIIKELDKDKKDLEFIGVGAARVVYGLNEDVVFKIENIDRNNEDDEDREHTLKFRNRIEKEIKEKTAADCRMNDYYNFIKILGLKDNNKSIKIFTTYMSAHQSIQELINWNSIKETILKNELCEIYDIFIYRDSIIVVQERGTPLSSNGPGAACIKEPEGTEYDKSIDEDEIYNRIDELEDMFDDKGFFLSDAHKGNFVVAKNGKLKLCDFGWGNYLDTNDEQESYSYNKQKSCSCNKQKIIGMF